MSDYLVLDLDVALVGKILARVKRPETDAELEEIKKATLKEFVARATAAHRASVFEMGRGGKSHFEGYVSIGLQSREVGRRKKERPGG